MLNKIDIFINININMLQIRRVYKPTLTIEDAKIAAKAVDSKFLSDEFINTKTIYLWQCNNGHDKFKRSYSNFVYNGNCCPFCRKTVVFPVNWYKKNRKKINEALTNYRKDQQ